MGRQSAQVALWTTQMMVMDLLESELLDPDEAFVAVSCEACIRSCLDPDARTRLVWGSAVRGGWVSRC